jgi:hypothetical protein
MCDSTTRLKKFLITPFSTSSSSSSAAPSATSSAPAKHGSNTALLAGIFVAVALLLLVLILLGAWLCIRRRRRRQRDRDLAAAGMLEKDPRSARSWHMRGGDGASSRRSVHSTSSSENLHNTTESHMVFKPSGAAAALALGAGAGAAATHADQHHLLARYPSDALMSPGSPVSFDRVTHPDGSYFPVVRTPGPRGAAAVYGGGLAGIGAMHARQASDPFADDPRRARASADAGSMSDVGEPWTRRAGDDPSFVFGESFLAGPHGGPRVGGPLVMPAPALAHASYLSNSTHTSSSGSGSGPRSSSSGVPFPRGAGPGAPNPDFTGSDTGLWLGGGKTRAPAPFADSDSASGSSEGAYDPYDLGHGSTQIAAASSRRAPGSGAALAPIPERANSGQSVYMTPEAGTPAAVNDTADYAPARRLSVRLFSIRIIVDGC